MIKKKKKTLKTCCICGQGAKDYIVKDNAIYCENCKDKKF